MIAPESLIAGLRLEPHPEGGFYRETHRAALKVAPEGFSGERAASTSIYYLLTEGTRSRLHRIKSDEVWHFHLGSGLRLSEIGPDGKVRETVLGTALAGGHVLQHAVPAGHWFGAEPLGAFSLVGCTVAPGFDFSDLEWGERQALLERFPNAKDVIGRLA